MENAPFAYDSSAVSCQIPTARHDPIQSLLSPLPLCSASHNGPCSPLVLYRDERHLVNGASAKRIGEFCAGRLCAHRALEQLGFSGVPVLKNRHGAPIWPEGIVGSISHSGSMAVAAAARSADILALGIDIQCYCHPFPRQTYAALFRPQEIRLLLNAPSDTIDLYAYCLFAAKESVLKCMYCAFGHWLEFCDILIDMNLAGGCFSISISNKRALDKPGWSGRIFWDGAYVFTAAWLPQRNEYRWSSLS